MSKWAGEHVYIQRPAYRITYYEWDVINKSYKHIHETKRKKIKTKTNKK